MKGVFGEQMLNAKSSRFVTVRVFWGLKSLTPERFGPVMKVLSLSVGCFSFGVMVSAFRCWYTRTFEFTLDDLQQG